MTKPPQEVDHSHVDKKKRKGLIIVHTGDGKGKTTAALGMAFRAAGNGMKVAIVQFIKGNWKYGEMETAKQVSPPIEIHQMGEGFTWDTKNPERDRAKAHEAFEFGRQKMMSGEYDMVIFDEINYAIDYDFLDVDEVIEAIKQKGEMTHVVLTGRNAPEKLIEAADLATEMKTLKHPWSEQGIPAQKGIEF